MKKFVLLLVLTFLSCTSVSAEMPRAIKDSIALDILSRMSLREKIGQKLMLDFRYWCTTAPINNKSCTEDFVVMNPTVKNIINQNHIGGIILFANNLKTIEQIITLTDALQKSMSQGQLPLFIGTDQEGGIVVRLPRDVSVTFPGNMAITAAYLGTPKENYSAKIAKILATDVKTVGVNINFAPDVDVNVNPLNPIINVRSFSDDPELVTFLGLEFIKAMQAQSMGGTLKHFPGHGDTVVDSHVGLPVVNHNLDEAWKIDLYPFKNIIAQASPDLIMTAHIQYPALDNSLIYAGKAGSQIITPATLSRKIQNDLLRNQLAYQGVVITDALDMGAIADNFDPTDATIKAFQAGDDIALMPVSVSNPEEASKVSELIARIELAVKNGDISLRELNLSVLRIIKLKLKLGLFDTDQMPLPEKIKHAQEIFADKHQRELENAVTNDAITLIQNNSQLLPIKLYPNARIHILTPWQEQGAGIAAEIKRLQDAHQLPQHLQVSFIKMAETNLDAEKLAIDNADIVIVGNSTTRMMTSPTTDTISLARQISPKGTLVFPEIPNGDEADINTNKNDQMLHLNTLSDAEFAYEALKYAKDKGKKTIFISLLAPYDLPNYKNVADAMLAGYDYYGYLSTGDHGYYRGPSMAALTRVIFGISRAKAKLPINIPNPLEPSKIVYLRGYGLST